MKTVYRFVIHLKSSRERIKKEFESRRVPATEYEFEDDSFYGLVTSNEDVVSIIKESISERSYTLRQLKPFRALEIGEIFYRYNKGCLWAIKIQKTEDLIGTSNLREKIRTESFEPDTLVETEL